MLADVAVPADEPPQATVDTIIAGPLIGSRQPLGADPGTELVEQLIGGVERGGGRRFRERGRRHLKLGRSVTRAGDAGHQAERLAFRAEQMPDQDRGGVGLSTERLVQRVLIERR